MGIRVARVLALALLAGSTGACTWVDQTYFDKNRMSMAGPRGVIARDLEAVDLFAQIARGNVCKQFEILFGFAEKDSDTQKCKTAVDGFAATQDDPQASARLARAYAAFDRLGDERAGLRNQIQDEIFRASEQRCNAYKVYLQRIQSNTNFTFGSLATALGGLGAIFTDAGVARAFSGSAAITSGVGAQFNENYFFNLAVPVISDGIDMARATVHDQAMQSRKPPTAAAGQTQAATAPIESYTLQAAILDAVRYDGACSIPEGLKKAAEAVKAIRNPGADMLLKSIDQYNSARDRLNQQPQPARPGQSQGGGQQGSGQQGGGQQGSGQQSGGTTPAPTGATSRIQLPSLTSPQ